ncbi:hypothetical protein D6825_01990 [Candidatus Woesearchaeota archaeon]|nr:MAG: hypothetical protein D6825_01990 [Candidatus Woesearchaeota archaeon]
MKDEKKDKKPLIFGIIAGGIASLCCVGPVILVGLGLSSVSFALSIGQYTWLFTTIGTLFLITTLLAYYKKKNCCTTSGLRKQWKQILATFLIMVGILILVKFWLATQIAQIVYR